MSEAEKILQKHQGEIFIAGSDYLGIDEALSGMREIAEKAFDAGRDYSNTRGCWGEKPDKSTFLTNLFKEI